jgi:glycosyltransferase involved in cell wall biosynthesis
MKLTVVIPAHNEEGNIAPITDAVLQMFSRHGLDAELVIVDDNSTDRTKKISDSLARKHRNVSVIHRNESPGMGNALKAGTNKAHGKYVAWVMGDRCDNIETIPKMVRKLDSGYDMVFGSRYMAGGSSGDLDRFKALSSSGYTVIARLVFGFRVHDITNAFRAFRKSVFSEVEIESEDFAISPEFAIKAHLAGFRLGEVPTTYHNRVFGKTKFRMMQMGLRYFGLLRYRFSKRA